MIARVGLAVLCVLGGFVLGAPAAAPELAPPPRPVVARSVEDPPTAIAALLKQARDGAPLERIAALKVLGTTPEAEPYLRLASMSADPDLRPRLKRALTEHHIAIDARNVERAKKWATDGRIDMLVEAICFARYDTTADAMTEHLCKFAASCSERATKLLNLKDEEFPRLGPIRTFEEMVEAASTKKPDGTAKTPTVNRHSRGSDDPVQLDNIDARGSLVRAEQVESKAGLAWSIAVVRDQWTGVRRATNDFSTSFLFINANIKLDRLDRCLVVTDGNVTNWDAPGAAVSSVVIARGSVRGESVVRTGSSASCLWAGGNITLPISDAMKKWAVLAGGKLDLETSEGCEPVVRKEKTTENPFGVRFFELKELGVEVEDHADGVRIQSLAPGSPLAVQGLRAGDIVFRVNEQATDSVKEFRRELRRSLVWEAGVFWLARDGHRLTRVVHFPDGLK